MSEHPEVVLVGREIQLASATSKLTRRLPGCNDKQLFSLFPCRFQSSSAGEVLSLPLVENAGGPVTFLITLK